MNLQQAVQTRHANGFGSRKVESGNRINHKFQPGKSNPNRVIGPGLTSVSKGAGPESLSRDRLVYLTTCLIGHHVDVQVKNGSIYSGIFHATSADKDFGIILKMARLTRDVSIRGPSSGTDSVSKAPSKTLIIPGHEFVQVVAKDLPVTGNGLSDEIEGESQKDIMLDSYISQSRHVDAGRELKPWMPDADTPQCPELENIFESPWTGRSWDQFKVNETLFGVKSTFNEELYTTKLEKGPQMRELEEEARRIAREIEGEDTYDRHLAEERGAITNANDDIDEETKYSSVFRGFDDSGFADEDMILNSHDLETFGDSAGSGFSRSFADVASGRRAKGLEGGRASSALLKKDESHTAQSNVSQELYHSVSQISDSANALCGFEDDCRAQKSHIDDRGGSIFVKESSKDEDQAVKSDDFQKPLVASKDASEKSGVSSKTTTSSICTKVEAKTGASDLSENKSAKVLVAEPTNSRGRPGNFVSSTFESGVATSGPGAAALSPSSSVSSLSSEKSTLNPNAKEFRLNPTAKSFVPLQSPLRPASPVNDVLYYFPAAMPTVPHMHGIPVGVGGGPPFGGHQPVLYNPQAAAMQAQQAYYPANGPQYGQQMIHGHPRQVMYMQGYPSGREF